MANKVTIDVEARFIDNVTDEAKAAAKSFGSVEKAAEEAKKDVDKLGKTNAKPKVTIDSNTAAKKLDALDKKLNKIGKSKTDAKLGVIDKATAIIDKVTSKVKAFANKTYSALVKLRDSNALSTLSKMSNGIKSLTSKVWSVAVKIKDTFTAPLTKLKNMLFNVRTLIAGIASAWAAVKFIKAPIDLADAYSSAKIGFSTLLGETAGQKMMDDLDEFAKATPFKTSGVIANAQKMMAMGWDTDTLLDDLEVIGNAAAATGKLDQGLESIVRAMSQIKTKGKLSTEELNQLAEAGIAAKAMLAEGLGYGTGDAGIAKMTEDLEKGVIQSDIAIKALIQGMHKYDGMMDSMANETVEGLWSQIQDVFEINILRKWGQGLQDGAKRGFGTLTQLLEEAEGALAELGDTLYEIGHAASNWVADKFQGVVDKILKITDTYEFKTASLSEKISMLWNGVIVDPLKEWWENGGEQKTAETAGKIGSWMGEMLTKGLLALFGATDVLNEGLGTDAGSNVAGSFVRGFLDNFDGKAITDAFVNAIGNIWGALPGWAKFLIGSYGIGKAAGGIANFAGNLVNFADVASKVVGSASAGTGILGYGAETAIALGAGNLAGGASVGAGTLSALGLGATAGGVVGGAALIKGGIDLYKGYTTDDEVEAKARKASGYTAAGGVAAGAGIGAAIGSVVPVLGTAVGALLGAGIGGLAGWLGGNAWADEIRKTDDAVNDLTASTEDLETEQEKLEKKAKMVYQNMRDHFGDIKLSMSEIQSIAKQIVWGNDLVNYEQFTTAAQTAEASLDSLKSAAETTNRWMWKASLGMKFSQDEVESIIASFDEYITGAQSYLENKHYEFTAAVSLLLGTGSGTGESIIGSGNAFYGKLQEQLNDLGGKLSENVEIALQDGVITLDEHDEIINLQKQIAEITQKISDAETTAELELIKVKFGGGRLDPDSFADFMTQMEATLNERISANDDAFKASVSSLQLQLEDGAITDEEYNAQLKALIDGYTGNVDEIKARIMDVELEIIGDAYLRDGATREKLQNALETSLKDGVDPITWSVEDARNYLGLPNLKESSAEAISQMLGEVAGQLKLVDVDGQLMLHLGVVTEDNWNIEFQKTVREKVPETLDEQVNIYLTGEKHIENSIDVMMEEFGIEREKAESVLWKLSGTKTIEEKIELLCTDFGFTETQAQDILWKLTGIKSITQFYLSAGDFGIRNSYSFSPTVNVTPRASIKPLSLQALEGAASGVRGSGYRGGIFGGSFARGGEVDNSGIVGGSTRYIRVNEESPEMIIPLSDQRRGRALKLWAQAGNIMGVPGFARGGIIGGDNTDAGFRFKTYGGSDSAGGRMVHVSVGGVKLEINVNGSDREGIVEAIKAQAGDLADYFVGIIADALETEFENTPVRGGA